MNTSLTKAPAAIDQLLASFQHLPNWEKRYSYLIELGNTLPALNREACRDENCFRGCQSSVWFSAQLENQDGIPVVHFLANSDSKIVRGLIAVLHSVYSGQPVDFILNYDINELFHQLELDQHLDSGRRNGLYDMEMRLKSLARDSSSAVGFA